MNLERLGRIVFTTYVLFVLFAVLYTVYRALDMPPLIAGALAGVMCLLGLVFNGGFEEAGKRMIDTVTRWVRGKHE